ncbi:MAG: class I SAM-dependent methyltransferase [Acidimicrobiales bacterium]
MSAVAESPYAVARTVGDPEDCHFYHTMEVPGVGVVTGQWDLRQGVSEYLGNVALDGKRVLEIGTASGFLCFEMERRGAEVVAYDLSEGTGALDIVPFGGDRDPQWAADWSEVIRKVNNAFWLAHERFDSRARVVYGSVYEVPDSIGAVDVATFGCVLLHLRDPFLALERTLRLVRETVIVVEPAPRPARALAHLPSWAQAPLVRSRLLPGGLGFLPDHRAGLPNAWWSLQPWGLARMLGVLGFELAAVGFHTQGYANGASRMYTLVAKRPSGETAPVLRNSQPGR